LSRCISGRKISTPSREASLYAKERSERTRNKYRQIWKEFKQYLVGHCEGRDPVDALKQDVIDFLAHLRSDKRLVPKQLKRVP
jgi:N-glycosylase/DNA lyase